MRRTTASVMVGLFALATAANASAKSVQLAEIPQTELAGIEDVGTLPKRVRSGAKVEGIFPAQPPKRHRGGSPTAFLAPTKAHAKEFEREGWSNLDNVEDGACLTVVQSHMLQFRAAGEFPTEMTRQQTVWAESQTKNRVSVVRRERLIRNGEDATLEVTTSFVDAVSLGAQLVQRESIALRRIAAGPKNVQVFAARDGDRVQFVVTSADMTEAPELGRRFESLRVSSAGERGWSDCGFIRMTMKADGGGRAATVIAPVPLGIETIERSIAGAPTETPRVEGRRLSVRQAAVHLSVSRTTADDEPVVSVAFGWDGETERFDI